MPLNKKGEEIKSAMEKEYGSEKGNRVFYASENSGRIKGVTKGKVAQKKHEIARKMSK